jgi:hypothetical protein
MTGRTGPVSQGRNTTLRRPEIESQCVLNGRPEKPKCSHVFSAIGYFDHPG